MALKTRNQYDPGRMRAPTQPCPNCGSPCLFYSSHMVSARTRRFYVRCNDPLCGWQGGGYIEITHTISPPHHLAVKNPLPPMISDGEMREALNTDRHDPQGSLFNGTKQPSPPEHP